jgi:hypothetical protein
MVLERACLSGMVFLIFTNAGWSQNLAKEQILDQAMDSLRRIRSLEYRFTHAGDKAGSSTSEVVYDGLKYRITRDDTVPGERSEGRLFSTELAFDGLRQQKIRHDSRLVQLQDGHVNAWGITETPETMNYLWLSTWGKTPDLNEVRDKANWISRFEHARVIGESDEYIVPAVGVEFPSPQVDRPVKTVVWFSREHGCIPVARERRLETTGVVSSTFRVTEYVLKDLDGHSQLFPLSFDFVETGDDKVSLPQTFTMTIDPESLQVNHVVDEGRFTLPIPEGYEIRDVQLDQAAIAQAEALATAKGAAGLPDARSASLWSLLWVANGLLFLAIAGYVYWRRRP